MKKPPVIALLTDFGTSDAYVGAMKGIILSLAPNTQIVDISHEILPQDITQAAFLLWSVYRYFPRKTIFVCVVDPSVGSERKIICVEAKDYYFLAPDNGSLKFVLASIKPECIVELENTRYFLPEVSTTFHGRDVFAPVAAHIANGLQIRRLGKKINPRLVNEEFVEIRQNTRGRFDGKIIHIDRFGNLITNILFKKSTRRSLVAQIGGKYINTVSQTYTDAKSNLPFMIVGSSSLLEISVRNGNAQKVLHAKVNQRIHLTVL
jgi:S-adenosyl-L-methionine hydrolase (adenosine-forming)